MGDLNFDDLYGGELQAASELLQGRVKAGHERVRQAKNAKLGEMIREMKAGWALLRDDVGEWWEVLDENGVGIGDGPSPERALAIAQGIEKP